MTFWTSSIVIHHFLNRVHPSSLSQLDDARMADTYRYESYKNGFPILCASDYCAAATAAAAAVQPPNRRHRCRRLVHLCVFSRFSASKASSMSTILMYCGAWYKSCCYCVQPDNLLPLEDCRFKSCFFHCFFSLKSYFFFKNEKLGFKSP